MNNVAEEEVCVVFGAVSANSSRIGADLGILLVKWNNKCVIRSRKGLQGRKKG